MENDERIPYPDVIVADAGPLIHLAQADALYLLHAIGGRVVVPDMVAHEVVRDLQKPGAERLSKWLATGQMPGSNAPVTVDETDIGRLFAVARRADPLVEARGAGERAIIDWLADQVADTDHQAVVVYENGKVPRIVANQGMDADIAVMTTRALLQLAEDRAIVPSAAEIWARIVASAPTINPANRVFRQRRVQS